MKATRSTSDKHSTAVRTGAALSAAGWFAMFAMGAASQEHLSHFVAIVYHLALLPVVAALPVPTWAPWSRVAGYVWVFVDTLIDVAAINGLDDDTHWPLRLGIHIATAVWVAGASLGMRRGARIVGLLLAGSLAGYSLAGPHLPVAVLGVTAFPLMLAWLILIARGSATPAVAHDHVRPSVPAV